MALTRERKAVQLRQSGWTLRRIGAELRLSTEWVRQLLGQAEWKLYLGHHLSTIAMDRRMFGLLYKLLDDGYSLEGISSMPDRELLRRRLVGKKTAGSLRRLVGALLQIRPEKRDEVLSVIKEGPNYFLKRRRVTYPAP